MFLAGRSDLTGCAQGFPSPMRSTEHSLGNRPSPERMRRSCLRFYNLRGNKEDGSQAYFRYLNLLSLRAGCVAVGRTFQSNTYFLGICWGCQNPAFTEMSPRALVFKLQPPYIPIGAKLSRPYPFLCMYRLYDVLLYYICLEMKLCIWIITRD